MRLDAPNTTRKQPLLAEGHVAPAICHEGMPRLATCLLPFGRTFCRQAPAPHAHTYVYGLLSDRERKNVASIAYRFGHDRLPLHRCVGWAAWDEAPVRQELRRQVAPQWGHAEGGLVWAPSAFAQSGTASVGVARQWCGRLGQVDHCPVALYLGDVSGAGPTLVDMRLSLPKPWTQDQACLDKAGVPQARRG
jgi:SRSO17 transposase